MKLINTLFANWTSIALLVSGVVAVVASYFAGMEQNKQAARIEKLSTKNAELTESVKAAIDTNTSLTNKNLELTDLIQNEITGGDSYLFLTTSGLTVAIEQYGIQFVGDHAMMDVELVVRDKDKEGQLFADKTTIAKLVHEGGTAAVQRHLARAIDANFSQKRYIEKAGAFQPLKNIATIQNGESATYSYNTSSRNGKSTGYLFLHRDTEGALHTVEHLKRNDIVLHEKPENYPRLPNQSRDNHVPFPDWSRVLAD